MTGGLSKAETLAALPPPFPDDLRSQIRAMVASQPDHKLIVLDDDPTGTQTVHDVPVLTTWHTLPVEGTPLGMIPVLMGPPAKDALACASTNPTPSRVE